MKNDDSKKIIYNYDELDLKEVVSAINARRNSVLIIALIFIFGSLAYAFTAPIKFQSTSIAIPADSSATSMPQSSSGLAALAGINLRGNDTPVPKLVAALKSRDFFNHLLSFDGVYENLVAFDEYDDESKQSIFNEKMFDVKKGEWTEGMKPSKFQAYLVYKNSFEVYNPKLSNFINLKMEHGSPIFAKEFLELIIREMNEISRQRDLQQSSEALSYLYDQLGSVQQSDVQVAISQLIESQLKKQMLANVSANYALRIIDSPYEAELRESPKRKNILIIGTFLGILIGIIFVLMQHYTLKYFRTDLKNFKN